MAEVHETLTTDGTTPIGEGHEVSAWLIVVGYTGEGEQTRTIVGPGYGGTVTATTDRRGRYALDLTPTADIIPAGARWVIDRPAGRIEVTVGPDGGRVGSEEVPILTTATPVDASALALHAAAVAEQLSSRVGALLGPVALDGDVLVATFTSPWGIDPDTGPYFDPDGAAAGEAAVLHVTDAGAWALIQPEGTL